MFSKILVPLDGSKVAENAVTIAEHVAAKIGAEILLVHVLDMSQVALAHMHEAYLNGVTESVKSHLSGHQANAMKVSPVLLRGDTAAELVSFAHKSGIGLIVMSTRSRPGTRHFAMGNVSESVYRNTVCSCILTGFSGQEGSRQAGRMTGKIIVPIGRFASEQVFLSNIKGFDYRIASEVVFIRVIPPLLSMDEEQYKKVAIEFSRSAFIERLEQTQREKALEHLAPFVNAMKAKGLATSSVVLTGSTVDSVLEYAEQADADLIALPAQGQSTLGNWILGKLAKALLREAKTPVIMVKPGKAD